MLFLREFDALTQAIADVRAFHEACDVPVLDRPADHVSEDRRQLRKKLIQEEFRETWNELHRPHHPEGVDRAKLTKELCDLIYVAIGTALEFGLPLSDAWAEVQRSNMAKVDPETVKVRKRADGKILKPEGWQPADIRSIVEGVS